MAKDMRRTAEVASKVVITMRYMAGCKYMLIRNVLICGTKDAKEVNWNIVVFCIDCKKF